MKNLFLRKARFASGHFSRGRHVLRWELRFVLGIRSGLHLVAQFQYPGLPDVTFPQLIASQSLGRIQSVHLLRSNASISCRTAPRSSSPACMASLLTWIANLDREFDKRSEA
jgi:hypothetical protein